MVRKRVKKEFCKSGEWLVSSYRQVQLESFKAPQMMLATGKERRGSLEEGEVPCHFCHGRDVLKNMPWVFLRNEDKHVFGSLGSKCVLLFPMRSKAKNMTYSNNESHYLLTVSHLLGISYVLLFNLNFTE